ncbi:hypothetical protein MELA_00685 [Candidatus Methylomirabilis lanthanidiphila]|uniref:Peptidase M48 domain-containing protein n=1 Tax=Candidatus Methylomirabilis lanthanidiphila TaxID=2211376 RepID=A0A564ZG91_9BACT|nr:hypothetical protein MELA_00685 [Candidatus Methylomirabilis lanthanidiphila]
MISLMLLTLTACTAGAGLQVLRAPDEIFRAERSAHTLVKAFPVNVSRRSFTFQIVRDDRASAWNIAPGNIYISYTFVHDATDDELAQLIAHSIGHDLLAHPVAETNPSGAREAAENVAIVVVPGGILLAGIVEGVVGSREYTLAQELDAERIGLRLWLYSGRTCASWISLRESQKAHGSGWHEPIKDMTPPFNDLVTTAKEECVGRP